MTSSGEPAYWDKIWNTYQILPVSSFAQRCYRTIEERKMKTLLELGCGSGRDAAYFASCGLQVTAVDYSTSGVSQLKSSDNQITCLIKDIREIDFPDDSFDVVYAHLSLHYFDDKTTDRIFKNIHRILKKGGLLFVKCKSTQDRLYGQGEKVGEDMYVQGHLRHFFSREYMAEKLLIFEAVHLRKTSGNQEGKSSAFIEATAVK